MDPNAEQSSVEEARERAELRQQLDEAERHARTFSGLGDHEMQLRIAVNLMAVSLLVSARVAMLDHARALRQEARQERLEATQATLVELLGQMRADQAKAQAEGVRFTIQGPNAPDASPN